MMQLLIHVDELIYASKSGLGAKYPHPFVYVSPMVARK